LRLTFSNIRSFRRAEMNHMNAVAASVSPLAVKPHLNGTATRVRFDSVVQRFRMIKERPDTLRSMFTRFSTRRPEIRDFMALKGISFDIRDGEAIGIIGRNGSGKSTILKIIAGVYRPTVGRVEVNGRVSALIELGAGFHHELTGRENITIGGLLHGLNRKQICAREAGIIEFAELGSFIDSPVKQYSTGMYMRLAFALAVEVDGDILLVDEVLSVGDEAFRRKCMARIAELRKCGKTMVLVSHDMSAIRDLCSRALLFHRGDLLADGPPESVIGQYMQVDGWGKSCVTADAPLAHR
jgi:lipopolysaccharide transport system ATP-binding protein